MSLLIFSFYRDACKSPYTWYHCPLLYKLSVQHSGFVICNVIVALSCIIVKMGRKQRMLVKLYGIDLNTSKFRPQGGQLFMSFKTNLNTQDQ
jgi:hypothetical protein